MVWANPYLYYLSCKTTYTLGKHTLSRPHLGQYNRYGSNFSDSSGLKLTGTIPVTAHQRNPTLPWQDFHFNGNWDRSSPKSQLGWSVLPNLPLHCGKFASAIACYLLILTDCSNKNIEKHTAHTIVSWPNPKQWVIVHTSDLMMIIRQTYVPSNPYRYQAWSACSRPWGHVAKCYGWSHGCDLCYCQPHLLEACCMTTYTLGKQTLSHPHLGHTIDMDRILVIPVGWNWQEMYLWLLPNEIRCYLSRNFTSMATGIVQVQNRSLGGACALWFASVIACYLSIPTDCSNNVLSNPYRYQAWSACTRPWGHAAWVWLVLQ